MIVPRLHFSARQYQLFVAAQKGFLSHGPRAR